MNANTLALRTPVKLQTYPHSHRRASNIRPLQRVSHALLGSPSVSRANGGRKVSPLFARIAPCAWRRRCANVPVFEVERQLSFTQALPRIWITEPAFDEKGEMYGREFVSVYPNGKDETGMRAFSYGQAYFAEALSLRGSDSYQRRLACLRAAEILFLHAAQRGHLEASVRLGVIYADDLCEGKYWRSVPATYEHLVCYLDARAVECFSFAAAHTHAEGCWQLADLLLAGRGCKPDAERAYNLCLRAHEIALVNNDACNRGNAALRIAYCFEQALGCEHSFKHAYAWYRIAEEQLKSVMDEGGWYFKRAYLRACKGAARMRQELLGNY